MPTALLVLAVLATIAAVFSAMGSCPLWVPIILLSAYALIQQLPVGNKGSGAG